MPSVSHIHGHNDLDATPLADSGINDGLIKKAFTHRLDVF